MSAIDDDLAGCLLSKATQAASHAYAPYSGLKVGAALITASGAILTGCNVENATYGLTMCAERNAIFSAVAAQGDELEIEHLAVATADERPISPCGACRQVMCEFNPEMSVIFRSPTGLEIVRAEDLLPYRFRFDLGA